MKMYNGEEDYEAAIEKSLRSVQLLSEVLNREREVAPKQLARLARLSPNGLNLLLNNSPSFHSWGLFEILIRTG